MGGAVGGAIEKPKGGVVGGTWWKERGWTLTWHLLIGSWREMRIYIQLQWRERGVVNSSYVGVVSR